MIKVDEKVCETSEFLEDFPVAWVEYVKSKLAEKRGEPNEL